MLKKLLPVIALTLCAAAPALAYPTSVVSVPNGDVLKAGTLHIGSWYYGTWGQTQKEYTDINNELSLNLGVFDGVEYRGTKIGRLELSCDLTAPRSFIGQTFDQNYKNYSLSYAGKLGLCSETDLLPSVAVGTYYTGFPKSDKTANVMFASASKQMYYGGNDLGQYTIGGYQMAHTDATDTEKKVNGLLLGATHATPVENLSAMADYLSGDNALAGTNLCLSYGLGNFSVSGGYYLANKRDTFSDIPFLFVDYNIPFLSSSTTTTPSK